LLPYFAENDVLYAWVENLWRERPDLGVDPSVMRANQINYTGRPIFEGWDDPVPVWGRVRVLDGCEDTVTLELSHDNVRPKSASQWQLEPLPEGWADNLSPEYLDLTEQYAERGIHALEVPDEPSVRVKNAVQRIFGMLKGCPTGHDKGRHDALTKAAWELTNFVAEFELTEEVAHKAFDGAAAGIKNADKKYPAKKIDEYWNSAIKKVGRR
jgi:hypothetical protein